MYLIITAMTTNSPIKVIWYNVSAQEYQSGTWNDLKNLMSSPIRSYDIQPLERFNDTSEKTIKKIVGELNKCKPASKVIP